MTPEQYQECLKQVENRNPSEPLLKTLRHGHTRANELYMAAALRRIHKQAEQVREKDDRPPADKTLRALWSERTRLFGEMNKQSNKFHECRTDADRATNSARVLGWWNDILAVKEKIAYYEQHGELPPVPEDGDELPDNAALLAKKLNSLRVSVSQQKKKLEGLAGLDPGTPGLQSKIDAAENNLKRLRWLVGLAEQKLKNHEQAA